MISPKSVTASIMRGRRGVYGGELRFMSEALSFNTTLAILPNEIDCAVPVELQVGDAGAATSFYIAGPPVPTVGGNVIFSEPMGLAMKIESGRAIFDSIEARSLVVTNEANIPANGGNIGGGLTLLGTVPYSSPVTTWNLVRGEIGVLTLNGTVAIEVINSFPGAIYHLLVKQDAIGGHNIIWPESWKFPGGEPPSLSTRPDGMDLIKVVCLDSNTFLATADYDYT